VLSLLGDLVRDTGTTLLVATHDPEVLPRADRVLHLHGGTLHEEVPEYIGASQ
jgi:putative ABC transport system ATP-binding protein